MAINKTEKKANKKSDVNLFAFRSLQDCAGRLLGNVKTDGEKYARKSFKMYKGFIEDVINDPGGVMTGIFDNGKKFVSCIQTDARKKINGMVKKGRKTMDEFPTVNSIGNKISNAFKTIPGRINLASKNDIDQLIAAVETLDKKLDDLGNNYSTS